jgi:asparagine synthase (glutamine-hydrolysing)
MCGIVGLFGEIGSAKQRIEAACRLLHHRGPDDKGVWTDDSAGIAFGHTRLSILDLSPAGHQPMESACGRYVIVFNGEIYNHQDLRKLIAQYSPQRWRGHSDTETLLACISEWGLQKTLQATVGMFALGLWDRLDRKLYLARDRIGEKPLYYGYAGNAFVFASELKALAVFEGFSREIDRGALALLMRHDYVPAPHTIYRGIYKIMPGTWLEMSPQMLAERSTPEPKVYWSAIAHANAGARESLKFGSDAEAVDSLDALLKRAVGAQMVADVPLGAFLSGGIDSSTVVSLMQAQSSQPVRTFSIGFHVPGYNEAEHARAVARHLGTEHTELYLSADEALAVIPRLPAIYDEPFADSSQIPTHLVARLARERDGHVPSGDGGDELFGGYNRYFLGARVWRYLAHVPRAVRRLAARLILVPSPMAWDAFYALLTPFIPLRRRLAAPGDFLHKGARLLDAESGMTLYRGLVSHWEPAELVLREPESSSAFDARMLSLRDLTETMMALDAVTYLPDDILVKVDRAAMAVGLETRVPMLDHRVFEFAWKLPMHYKVRGGAGKWILREVLRRYVPRELIDRPKMGFAVPIDSWLRGPLRGWAEDLLDEAKLRREGYFDPTPIRRKWAEHLSGRRNWQYYLWDVLMFQAWLDYQQAPAAAT